MANLGPKVSSDLGVSSMLAFQLSNSQNSLGALNLYSKRTNAFDDDAHGVGLREVDVPSTTGKPAA